MPEASRSLLRKGFKITEKIKAQYELNVFNLTNTTSLDVPQDQAQIRQNNGCSATAISAFGGDNNCSTFRSYLGYGQVVTSNDPTDQQSALANLDQVPFSTGTGKSTQLPLNLRLIGQSVLAHPHLYHYEHDRLPQQRCELRLGDGHHRRFPSLHHGFPHHLLAATHCRHCRIGSLRAPDLLCAEGRLDRLTQRDDDVQGSGCAKCPRTPAGLSALEVPMKNCQKFYRAAYFCCSFGPNPNYSWVFHRSTNFWGVQWFVPSASPGPCPRSLLKSGSIATLPVP